MQHVRLPFVTLVSACIVAALHVHAINNNLYNTIFWFDILVHFCGGVFVALAAATFLDTFGFRTTVPLCIAAALAAGIAWEIFELLSGFPHAVWMNNSLDIAKDLCMDVVGGVVGAWGAQYVIK